MLNSMKMKFVHVIKLKMTTIVGILKFMTWTNDSVYCPVKKMASNVCLDGSVENMFHVQAR